MTADIIVQQGFFGDIIEFPIFDEDGIADDLTQYASVLLVMDPADFSSNKVNYTFQGSELGADGIAKWTPTSTDFNTVGKYLVTIKRIGATTKRPTTIFSIIVEPTPNE